MGRPRLDAVPWGWQSPVGTPRLPRSRDLKGPLWLGYLRRDPAPRPEGECVRVCVSVCRWARVGSSRLGAGRIPRAEGGGRGLGSLWVLLLSLSPSFSVSLTCGFQLLTSLGGGVCVSVCVSVCVCVFVSVCVCVCTSKPKATFYGDVVKGKGTLTHLIYTKTLDMSGLRH